MYYAHVTEDERKQTARNHSEETAKLAESFAVDIFKQIAYECGLLHDVGKYTLLFQKRLEGSNIRVEHSICGAQWISKHYQNNPFLYLMEYCIAGHHTGLPDGGADVDIDSQLKARLKRKSEDFSYFLNELSPAEPDSADLLKLIKENSKSKSDPIELYAFFTKYVFSCLTDADFINTEAFCSLNAERGIKGNMQLALERLDDKLNNFKMDTNVRVARRSLIKQAVANSQKQAEIHLLNMPTGSGKTFCSLKIALEKAISAGKKHIIYVIPYTSIIEQTANEFNKLFGDVLYVLQHHSNFDFDTRTESEIENETTAEKLKKTCENWDAPLIITTSVQFFQSLYHYKSSRLRKLHNLADSIIIFDEIHLIPIKLLQPCLRAVGYITKFLNSEAIFLSATMPDYSELFAKFLPYSSVSQLVTDKSDFNSFNNCTYINMGQCGFENVVAKADEYTSSLIIVNSRKSARAVYNMCVGKKFHLSTYMTPVHRSQVIKEIKKCLKEKEKIVVVSTSLVEAGVDFDFETVFREIAGLDSILQSGGRCNREGERENGYVYVFESGEKLKGDIQIRANVTRDIMNTYSDITSSACIEDYYNRLFGSEKQNIESNSIASFEGRPVCADSIPFKSYALNFEYIESDTIALVIDDEMDEKCHSLVNRLKAGDLSVKRQLQPYSVSLYSYEMANVVKLGIADDFGTGVLILTNGDYYTKEIGFCEDIEIKYIMG